ncbi:uncharacterized protein B0T23DRAFT_200682 [Neurospora hispaniola]|uniref:Mid2 domain-containing protein n=1 Tax=Neurospora hispaniola TaxID=588809 RepID=A0AAJ0I452_9PEZI|nr:hypothetical protein B0T23DRAFT_200682 [Neurospora hispaniola]
MQLSRLLLVGLSALSVAEASYIRKGVNVPHHNNVGPLVRRADSDSSSADLPVDTSVEVPTPETTSTKAAPATTTSADPPAEPTTTTSKSVSVPAATTTSPPPAQTTTKPSNNDQPTVTANPNGEIVSSSKEPAPAPSSSAGGSGGSSNNDDDNSKSSTSVKPIIKTITQIITTTNQQGVATTVTSEALTTSTPPPSLASGKGSKDGDMSSQTRNTIIGVVVGIGGAIILAGLGIVGWRIYGRKKQSEEADNLMDYNDAGKPEVGGSMVGRTPFQSTLESYHAPTHVNQASNF